MHLTNDNKTMIFILGKSWSRCDTKKTHKYFSVLKVKRSTFDHKWSLV